MTTVVCNRTSMAADKRITSDVMFSTAKIFRVGDSIFGFAGSADQGLKFIEWRKKPDQPLAFSGSMVSNFLELNPRGIFLWQEELIPIEIEGDFFAIGTGAMAALGALSVGCSLKRAIQIAARWNEATGSEVQTMTLKVK